MAKTEATDGRWSPAYRVSVKPPEADTDIVKVGAVVGSSTPVCLSLSLLEYKALTRAETITDAGVILKIDMNQDTAMQIYLEIGNLAKQFGWTLPKV
jgi:hypothetical protein